MIRILIWYVLVLLVCGLALRRGGAPERLIAAAMLAASLVTTALPIVPGQSYYVIERTLVFIDVAMLVLSCVIAVVADRFWPLWFAAVQLFIVAVHGVRIYDETILPIVYARLSAEPAYAHLLLLATGIQRHFRRAPEADWTAQRRRAGERR